MRLTKTHLIIATAAVVTTLLSGCHGGSRTQSLSTVPGSAVDTAVVPTAAASAPVAAAAVAPRLGISFFGWDPKHENYLYVHNGQAKVALKGSEVYYGNTAVAPDGHRIAWVAAKDRSLWVANVDGTDRRRAGAPVNEMNYSIDWTADGTGLIATRNAAPNQPIVYGTVRIADGSFTALPKSLQGGLHFRMTPDGKHYLYIADGVSFASADLDGTHIVKTPIIGDRSLKKNPRHLRAVDIISSDATGDMLAVNTWDSFEYDRSVGSSLANTLIGRATGRVLALPVKGAVEQILFRADGNVLVRSRSGSTWTLTLLSPARKVLTTRTESSLTSGIGLLAVAG
ncbi:Vegetative incompatibility protein HET-E-1 [Actinoplanes sp. SE50]|uniref:TolB family protein n=1 Tax=unclassified Actinoplanes TaxID=2626549 RepID=UPI00023EDD5A|nr:MULTISPECIES: hypothetical protein [unclassified Actinoplanes]AEV89156.1 Vegetative incompatibility protein HET-E-1 [Actinoplanes sp. SE50/110]ATO87562.1 Vegetative incompatibility protein HET-E-1 [Actinoplanes sp. SE50]SLM04980.1 Vegetative incompatibility protein HET-E-1 [Actinoplanes sp. SE50/110]